MTDREIMQQALDALEEGLTSKEWRELAATLRERLAQPQRTHWEGCEEVHPECRKPEQEPVAWADEIIDDLHAQYNTDGIKEIDSGDALIRLDEAIAAVEEAEKRHTAPSQRKPLMDERIESVRHMRDVQGYDGNWNYDPYMQGLYNGLEFALSLLEVRQPEFKDAPATWLGDIKFKRDKLSSEAAHGIKENT